MNTISFLMLKEHDNIRDHLLELLNAVENGTATDKIFHNFKWNLEKHLFLEEKAIFYIYQKINGQEVSEVFDVMQEHIEINNLLKEISESYNNNETLKELALLLDKHSKYEDETLYPYLDEYLNENQKKEVISRIKEIVF